MWDKSRFPRGLAPLGQACAQAGAQLLLWFEPERVRPQTCLAENHPQWLLHARKDDGTEMENMLLNLGDPACLQALTAHINALIQEAGVKIYRQDFNFDPAPYWDQNEAPDRVGMLENLHVQGYLAYWDALRPGKPRPVGGFLRLRPAAGTIWKPCAVPCPCIIPTWAMATIP